MVINTSENRQVTKDEEVKYRTDHRRCIMEISKTVAEAPEGEAVGDQHHWRAPSGDISTGFAGMRR